MVDDADAALVNMAQLHDVALGTLADGNDVVGLADGLPELPCIDLRVNPMVELGVAEEDEVMDGDNALDAAAPDAHGQLTGKTMKELYAIALQL